MPLVADALPTRNLWGTSLAALRPRFSAGWLGAVLLAMIAVPCFVTLPWSLERYTDQDYGLTDDLAPPRPPSVLEPLGSDVSGRSLLWRVLLGGAISLGIGCASAVVAVVIGVAWGAMAGYVGGRVDSFMMRVVDVLYGLPYILLVVLVDMALQPAMFAALSYLPMNADLLAGVADVATLLVAIGGVSWLTMARVIRGQVLSLRAQPFVEAARAMGAGPSRIIRAHLLPNLVGPIVVYTTLTVPAAILQESFLSFLGIGVRPPLPSWGNLASEGVQELPKLASSLRMHWWLLVFPCVLLGLTLMALNFLGDALRTRLDPRSRGR